MEIQNKRRTANINYLFFFLYTFQCTIKIFLKCYMLELTIFQMFGVNFQVYTSLMQHLNCIHVPGFFFQLDLNNLVIKS